jgi:hypothetical protein
MAWYACTIPTSFLENLSNSFSIKNGVVYFYQFFTFLNIINIYLIIRIIEIKRIRRLLLDKI